MTPELKSLCDRLEAWAPLVGSGYDVPAAAETILEAAAKLREMAGEIERLREALEPFSAMGRIMEARARVAFGRTVPDTEVVCESSGEVGMGILTMGHFRDAAALLPDAPGWGGKYKALDRASQETERG